MTRAAPAQLASFAGPGTAADDYAHIVSAADPHRAGIDLAVELGRRMLETGAVSAVNLSGGPADGGELAYAEALAEAGQRLMS